MSNTLELAKSALKSTHLNLGMLIISGQFMEIAGLYLPLRGIRMLSLQVMKMRGILSHLSRR